LISTQLLAIAYAIIAALTLNIWLSTKWSTGFKVSLIVLVSGLYVGTYISLGKIQGWPTTNPVPDSFRLVWAKIDEPDKGANSPGQIYLWLRQLDLNGQVDGEPRGYKLPYRIGLAENIEDALEKMEGGNRVNGRRTRGLIKPESEKPEFESQLAEGNESELSGFSDDRILLEFTELPRTPLPPKEVTPLGSS